MVTRNRKFPSQHGYSRNEAKRDTEQLVAEELYGNSEPADRLATRDRDLRFSHPRSRVALDLEPSVSPRPGVDLKGVTAHERLPEGPGDPWWVRLGLRLFRFLSWR